MNICGATATCQTLSWAVGLQWRETMIPALKALLPALLLSETV